MQWTMFRFALPTKPTVMPLFLADGRRAHAESFTDFVGLAPNVVDVQHIPYESGVEHKFHDAVLWLQQHQAPLSAHPGPVKIEIGLTILSFDESGKVQTQQRIDATGSARPVRP